jgi:hypothetical protein
MRMSIRQMCSVRIQSVARGMLVRKRMQRLRKRLQPLRRRIALARLASTCTQAAVQEEQQQASSNTAATEQQQASSSRPRELARRGGEVGGGRAPAGGDAGRRCVQQLPLPRWVARPLQGGAAGRQWVEVVEALRREVRALDTVT